MYDALVNAADSFSTLFSELAHLRGDNREAGTLLSGPGRFNRSIQGEKMRLIRDLPYGNGDIPNLGGLII